MNKRCALSWRIVVVSGLLVAGIPAAAADGNSWFEPNNTVDSQHVLPVSVFDEVQWYKHHEIALWAQLEGASDAHHYVVPPDGLSDRKAYRLRYPPHAHVLPANEVAKGISLGGFQGRNLTEDGRVVSAATDTGGGSNGGVYFLDRASGQRTRFVKLQKARKPYREYKVLGWTADRTCVLVLSKPTGMLGKVLMTKPWRIWAVNVRLGKAKVIYQPAKPKSLKGILFAGLSPDGKTLVYSRSITRTNVAAFLQRLDQLGPPKRLIFSRHMDVYSGGPIIWSADADGAHVFLACGSSIVCRYSGDGALQRVYMSKFERIGFADYDPKTHEILMTHIQGGQTGAAADLLGNAIEVANFDKASHPVTTQKTLDTYHY